MFTISKRFEFSASHVLSGLPTGHQCGRLHGHNYTVEVEMRTPELDPRGFVRDYGELIAVKEWLDHNLDHRHLNDVVTFNPTAELLAQFLYGEICQMELEPSAVIVCETPKTRAEYRP